MTDYYSSTSFSIESKNHEFLQDLTRIFTAYESV